MRKNTFFAGEKPKDMLALHPDMAYVDDEVMPYVYLNNAMVLTKYFDKHENMRRQPEAYFHIGYPIKNLLYNLVECSFPCFTGFYTVHGPSPLRKETYQAIWKIEPELLDKVCGHKFRHKEDINQYVLREYEKLRGNFMPENLEKLCGYHNVSNDNEQLVRAIIKHKYKILCLNDTNYEINFNNAKDEINYAFEQIFPEKSSFEI